MSTSTGAPDIDLTGTTIAFLATDGVEQVELSACSRSWAPPTARGDDLLHDDHACSSGSIHGTVAARALRTA